jgi:hypothetical protein
VLPNFTQPSNAYAQQNAANCTNPSSHPKFIFSHQWLSLQLCLTALQREGANLMGATTARERGQRLLQQQLQERGGGEGHLLCAPAKLIS